MDYNSFMTFAMIFLLCVVGFLVVFTNVFSIKIVLEDCVKKKRRTKEDIFFAIIISFLVILLDCVSAIGIIACTISK